MIRIAFRPRLRAATLHSVASVSVAALLAIIVFKLWYPSFYRPLAGGTALYALVMAVDLTLGPLLTFVVFNTKKSRRELVLDLAVVVGMQVAGLAYGTYTVFQARPIALVLEGSRFRLVTPVNVRLQELPQAAPAYSALPLTGPRMLATRASRLGEEQRESVMEALGGFDIGQRPTYWRPYDAQAGKEAWDHARPLALLIRHDPKVASYIRSELSQSAIREQDLRFMPVIARGDWTAVIDSRGAIRMVLPVDSYF